MKSIAIFSLGIIAKTITADDSIVCQAGSACAQALAAGIEQGYPTGHSIGSKGQFVDCSNDGAESQSYCIENGITTVLNLDVEGNSILQANNPANLPSSFSSNNEDDTVSPRFGLKVNIPVINNYGCWCYGGEYWPGARDWTGVGNAVDQWDEACKAHHMGFDCISLDAKAEGETCVPNETIYTLKVTPQNNGDYVLECADEIEDKWCERRVCLVDLRFIARHWHLEEFYTEPNYALYGHKGFHNNVGDFDNIGECVFEKKGAKGGNGGPRVVKVCCGEYPYRVWYDKNNNRGNVCCEYEDPAVTFDYGFSIQVGKLYNSNAQICCADGLKGIGSTC